MKLEKDEITQRLRAVKEAAKHGLESSSRSLDGVRSSLDNLKAQSEDAFAFAALAKFSLADVEELRTTVTETMKGLQVSNLAQCLKDQQAELNDALANGADFEAKLIASEERISQIREILSGKEAELEALTDVNKENTHLQTTLNERDMRIQELESLQPK
ncbi:hypothetical protein PHLCEN_2v3877 [Hermanssonia centrifuga]|uniref:Uncharacterized protein n=1 Tax=Hermanssonia centrifuga TaxID=98765 RepID=A0A2R6QB75_9APHY|nr:hypothetical protein PHLCEN_2v3877 [Hermanssonia centrifuga]